MNFYTLFQIRKFLYINKTLLLAMKFIVLIIFIAIFQVNAKSLAQKVSLSENNASIQKVFSAIKKQTGFNFLYDGHVIKNANPVNIHVENVELTDALDLFFATQPFIYELLNNTIVVKEKSALAIPLSQSLKALEVNEALQQQVTGRVVDEDGQSIQGASVLIKGTNQGATTDANGNFSMNLPTNSTLVISYIGYITKEVSLSNQSSINVVLKEDLQSLSDVVVTALGIAKEKRTLTYAVTEVGGENFTKAREINLGNALTGRVAGLNATSTATGPGGSSRIVIRGNGSLNGDNQPLIVVNGIPIENGTSGAGTYGGIDRGNGLSSINPDDIETISVLKGGTAAALYGSRAANGVILITTKSGSAQEGIGVEFNSTYTAETPRNLLDWQYEYGAGSRGQKPTSASDAIAFGRMSWGAKLDGSMVFNPDGVERPYVPHKDNIKNFYNIGSTFSNTLAISGGGQAVNFRFSASNLDNKGIVPNNSLNRKTFNLSANANLSNKILFEGRAAYSVEDNKNRPFTADFDRNPNAGTQIIATSLDVRDLAPGYNADGIEFTWSDYIFVTNPYFAVNKMRNGDTRNRFIGSFSARYNFTDYLYARARVGLDQRNTNNYDISRPSGTASNNRGEMGEGQSYATSLNSELLLGIDKSIDRFSLNAFIGGSRDKNVSRSANFTSGPLNVPFQYFIGNGSSQNFSQGFAQTAINSLFTAVDIGYNNYLFLNLTARKDWFSTLTKELNNILYPSAGLSFIVSDALGSKPEWLSFLKIRTSWAQVGGGAPGPYGLEVTYNNSPQLYINGATLQSIGTNTIPNKLKPYTSTTYEAGFEARIFSNRLGVDFTVYDRTTTDDIVNASVPNSTSYGSVALNVGEIKNRGVELLLTGTPSRTDLFRWDVAYNMAYNQNTVVNISENLRSIQLPGATTRTLNGGIYHYEGYPFGMIAGNRVARNEAGQIIYNSATGVPVQGPLEILGKGVPPLTIGLNNDFSFRNFNLGFLIDAKFGASVYSATNAYGVQFGLDKRTVENNVRETGVPVTGVDRAGAPYSGNVNAQTYYSTIWSTITEEFVTPADFIKLRSVTFGYFLPEILLNRTPFKSANISFVARNLLLVYNSARNIDPESSYNSGNAQGLENFGLPTVRSYGLNLSVRF